MRIARFAAEGRIWEGEVSPEVRLPLAPMRPENVERLRQVLRAYGLIP